MRLITDLKKSITLASLVIISSNLFGHSFNIGHTSAVFYDSERNRDVTTEIYYPSDNTGENESISSGSFPVLIFGHGFLMGWDAYQYLWSELVPNGYVICFATTETGITPNHEQFGEDLKFLAAQMQIETLDNTSLFYNSLAQETGLIGHSMGGGASFLAAENNSNIHALINFAAAETSPSAISAANNISVPALLFSGDDDCVAPSIDHQDPMYVNLSSTCKTQIKIIDGGHCYFADDNFNCNLGESFCNGSLSITRPEQQAVTLDFLNLWLDYSLKGDQNDFSVFNDSLATSNRINYLQACNSLGTTIFDSPDKFTIFPNPTIEKVNLIVPTAHIDGILTIYNTVGQEVYQRRIRNTNNEIDLSNFPEGPYFFVYIQNNFQQYDTIIKSER